MTGGGGSEGVQEGCDRAVDEPADFYGNVFSPAEILIETRVAALLESAPSLAAAPTLSPDFLQS